MAPNNANLDNIFSFSAVPRPNFHSANTVTEQRVTPVQGLYRDATVDLSLPPTRKLLIFPHNRLLGFIYSEDKTFNHFITVDAPNEWLEGNESHTATPDGSKPNTNTGKKVSRQSAANSPDERTLKPSLHISISVIHGLLPHSVITPPIPYITLNEKSPITILLLRLSVCRLMPP